MDQSCKSQITQGIAREVAIKSNLAMRQCVKEAQNIGISEMHSYDGER